MLLQARNSATSGAVDVSTDGGLTWVTKAGPEGYILTFVSDGTVILARSDMMNFPSYISTDGGNTWPTLIPPIFASGSIGESGWQNVAGKDGVFVVGANATFHSVSSVFKTKIAGIGSYTPETEDWPPDNCTSGAIFSTDHGASWQSSDLVLGMAGRINHQVTPSFDGTQFIAVSGFYGGGYELITTTAYSLDGQHWVDSPYAPEPGNTRFWSNKIGCTETA